MPNIELQKRDKVRLY